MHQRGIILNPASLESTAAIGGGAWCHFDFSIVGCVILILALGGGEFDFRILKREVWGP